MRKKVLVLNRTSRKKENLSVVRHTRKIIYENSRKPFSDRSNLVNKNSFVKKYDRKNTINMWSTSEDCKGENNPSTEGSNVNIRWTTTCSPFKSCKTENNLPSPIVYLENTSSDELTKHSSITCSCVCLEQLSSEDLTKHLKQCNVILSDVLHEFSNTVVKDNLENENCDDKNNVDAVDIGPRRFDLRKHKNVDYALMNRGSSLLTEAASEHIPIYNKQKIREHKEKGKDVYNFDLEMKKMKRNAKLNASTPYDKDTEDIMHKIEEKEKKQLNRRKKRPNNIKKNKEQETKLPVINNNRNKEFIAKRKVSNINNKLKIKETSTPLRNDNNLSYADTDRDDDTDLSDFDAAPLELEICSNDQLISINIANKVPDYRINILQNVDLRELMNNASNNNNSNAKKSDLHPRDQTQTKKSTSQANISVDSFDKLLTQNEVESFNFDTVEPPQGNSTPWRPDFQVKRNPFFLQYNQTLLPSYNQDMVIDSTCEEKKLPGNKTPRNYPHSNTKQTSILSYVNGKGISESPDIIESSLFDIHELSPIKSSIKSGKKSSRNSSNKENISITNTPNKQNGIGKAKRQILGERSSNLENISNSPAETSNNSTENSDEMTFFGFDNTKDKENDIQKPKKSIWLFGKPMRLEDYLTMAKTSKDKVIKQKRNKSDDQEQIMTQSLIEKNSGEDEHVNTVTDEELANMGLFEDLESMNKNDAPRKYEKVYKGRIRRHSINVEENDEDIDPHPRKRKRDKRTKEEEDEAEQWAKKFNKMCEEVEEYRLEVE